MHVPLPAGELPVWVCDCILLSWQSPEPAWAQCWRTGVHTCLCLGSLADSDPASEEATRQPGTQRNSAWITVLVGFVLLQKTPGIGFLGRREVSFGSWFFRSQPLPGDGLLAQVETGCGRAYVNKGPHGPEWCACLVFCNQPFWENFLWRACPRDRSTSHHNWITHLSVQLIYDFGV